MVVLLEVLVMKGDIGSVSTSRIDAPAFVEKFDDMLVEKAN